MDIATLAKVEKTSSKLGKILLIESLKEDSLRFLRWALDPIITFGVTVNEDAQGHLWDATSTRMPDPDFWQSMDVLCDKLSKRELTGNDAAHVISRVMMSAPTKEHLVWATRVLNKDLRSGFSISTLNKAHPGQITPFEVALAEPYNPEKHEMRGDWCFEPKLDGLRMIVMDGMAFTRNGRKIDSVGHILEELDFLGDQYVIDGEIMGATDFDEDSGKIRKKGMGPNLTLKFNAFDCIPKDEWVSKNTKLPFRSRRTLLIEALGTAAPKYTDFVPQLPLPKDPTTEQLFAVRDRMMKKGYEGAMAKNLDAPYTFDRSDNILKLKDFVDADGVIRSIYEGKKKHVGKLGGVFVEVDGVQTKCGSGFSDEQRVTHYNEGIIGKVVEVQYQNKTKDGKMRFPVFIKFRPDKE